MLSAFQVRDDQSYNQNLSELMAILKEEGLEILSLERRYLELEEAIYFKSRMISQTENSMLTKLGYTNKNKSTLRKDAYAGSS